MKFTSTFTFAVLAVCGMAKNVNGLTLQYPVESHKCDCNTEFAQNNDGITIYYTLEGRNYEYTGLRSGQCYPVQHPGIVTAHASHSSPAGAHCFLYQSPECDVNAFHVAVPNTKKIYLESFKCFN